MKAVRTSPLAVTGSQGECRLRLLPACSRHRGRASSGHSPAKDHVFWRDSEDTVALSRPGPQRPFERPVLLAAPHCAEKAEASASNTALGSGKNQLWWKSLIKLKPSMVGSRLSSQQSKGRDRRIDAS